jgi:hypothetical protein
LNHVFVVMSSGNDGWGLRHEKRLCGKSCCFALYGVY